MSNDILQVSVAAGEEENEVSVALTVTKDYCQVGSTKIPLKSPLTIGEAQLVAQAYLNGLWDGSCFEPETLYHRIREVQEV